MSNTPAASLPDDAAVDRELLVRDLLTTCTWALVEAMRASRQLAGNVDAIAEVNGALERASFGYRLQPLH